MRKISKILDEMMTDNPRLRILKVASALREALGDVLYSKVRIRDYSNGILILECSDPMWLSELNLVKDRVISKMNSLAGEAVVKRITIRRG